MKERRTDALDLNLVTPNVVAAPISRHAAKQGGPAEGPGPEPEAGVVAGVIVPSTLYVAKAAKVRAGVGGACVCVGVADGTAVGVLVCVAVVVAVHVEDGVVV